MPSPASHLLVGHRDPALLRRLARDIAIVTWSDLALSDLDTAYRLRCWVKQNRVDVVKLPKHLQELMPCSPPRTERPNKGRGTMRCCCSFTTRVRGRARLSKSPLSILIGIPQERAR